MIYFELKEFNRERGEAWRRASDPSPRPNGIACPTCCNELLDSEPTMTLASNPPQKSIHCPSCGYRGHRIA